MTATPAASDGRTDTCAVPPAPRVTRPAGRVVGGHREGHAAGDEVTAATRVAAYWTPASTWARTLPLNCPAGVQPLAGGFLDPVDFDAMAAQEERAVVAAQWAQLFLDVDAVLTHVTPAPAFPHDDTPDHGARTIVVDGCTRPYGEQFAWLQAVGALHLPAVVAPLTQSGGLPIGVQVVGPHLEDRTAVDVARRLARMTGGFVPPPLLKQLMARTRCAAS